MSEEQEIEAAFRDYDAAKVRYDRALKVVARLEMELRACWTAIEYARSVGVAERKVIG